MFWNSILAAIFFLGMGYTLASLAAWHLNIVEWPWPIRAVAMLYCGWVILQLIRAWNEEY